MKLHSLWEIIEHRASATPDAQAYTFLENGERDGDVLTWADVAVRSRNLAAAIAQSTRPCARVLLLFPPGLEFAPAFFGSLRARTIAVLAYPPAGSRADRVIARLRGVAADARFSLVVAPGSVFARRDLVATLVPELAGVQWLNGDDATEASAHIDRGTFDAADVAFLQYTSGSTSKPRGVMVTHGNLLHNADATRRAFRLTRDARMVSWLPPYHDMGLIGSIVQPVFTGFPSLHLTPAQFLARPLRWLEAITAERATVSGAPNFAYDLCVHKVREEQKAALDLSAWQTAYVAAETVRGDTLSRFSDAFARCGFSRSSWYPCYGLAESTLIVTGVEQGAGFRSRERDGRAVVGVGQLVTEGELCIVDPDTGERRADGEIGEIWVRSSSVALGYWNRPDETAAVFGASTTDGAGPFLRTGDLGFVCDGELHVTGRRKELMVVRGKNLYPTDVESTIDSMVRGAPYYRAGGAVAFSRELNGEERLFIAVEIERRHAERRGGTPPPQAAHERRGPDRRRRPFDYRSAAGPTLSLPEIARSVRAAVATEHGIDPSGVFLLRAGAVPKTSSGKKQRLALGASLLGEPSPRDVLYAWVAGRPNRPLREVA